MPPAPATAAPPKAGGKKILGMSRGQLGIVVLVAAGGIIFLVWRARKSKAAASSSSSSTSTGTCPDGSTPDANGNCPQNSQDFSGQLATLQQEIADLQAASGGGGSSGGSSDGGGSSGGGGGVTTGSGAPPPGTPNVTTGGGTLPAGQPPTQPQQVTKYPAPTGLTARADNSTTIAVSWNPVSPPASSYTLAVYQMNGKEVHNGSVGGVSSGKISTAVSGLHPSWQYQVHVWANGGAQAPPHASTIVTMPKS